jgi:segregation and condensation protein A
VSLSEITEQYIKYIKHMEELNIRVATEFIRMASELLYYKSRALLPSGVIDDEYFIPPLPPELVQKLLEYKKYQQASARLRENFEKNADCYQRTNPAPEFDSDDEYFEMSLFDLLKAFAEIMESQTVIEEKEIVFDEILVSDRIEHVKSLLAGKDVLDFVEIFSPRPSRPEIVVTFLAILELAKTKFIKILQHRVFGSIRIVREAKISEQ